jgi:hypothetical protein
MDSSPDCKSEGYLQASTFGTSASPSRMSCETAAGVNSPSAFGWNVSTPWGETGCSIVRDLADHLKWKTKPSHTTSCPLSTTHPLPPKPNGQSRNYAGGCLRKSSSTYHNAPSSATSTSTATLGASRAECPSRPTAMHGKTAAKASAGISSPCS